LLGNLSLDAKRSTGLALHCITTTEGSHSDLILLVMLESESQLPRLKERAVSGDDSTGREGDGGSDSHHIAADVSIVGVRVVPVHSH
jgi:hypothetical protein